LLRYKEKFSLKRRISISFIALSTLMLLVLSFVPHHHHEGIFCVIMERCEQDDAVNDEHTQHGDATDNHRQSCIAEAEYLALQSGNETKCKVSCDNPDHTHLYPILFLVADFVLHNADKLSVKAEYREYTSFNKSAETSRFLGLRAPPIFLS